MSYRTQTTATDMLVHLSKKYMYFFGQFEMRSMIFRNSNALVSSILPPSLIFKNQIQIERL